jgi:hypothetical protein
MECRNLDRGIVADNLTNISKVATVQLLFQVAIISLMAYIVVYM